jgi:hypothetical protein
VIAVVAPLLFGLGASAVLAGEYRFGTFLIVGSAFWALAKATQSVEPLSLTLGGSVFICICLLCIQYRIDSTEPPPIKATRMPLLVWKRPPSIDVDTPLSKRELNATASVDGKPVEGKFVYIPTFGATLPVGSETLSVTFYPDQPDRYSTQTATVVINVRARLLPRRPPTTPKLGPTVAPPPCVEDQSRRYKCKSDAQLISLLAGEQSRLRSLAEEAINSIKVSNIPPGRLPPNEERAIRDDVHRQLAEDIRKCCFQDLTDLRDEAIKRIGLPRMDLQEVDTWGHLKHSLVNISGSPGLWPETILEYDPYLTKMEQLLGSIKQP